MPAPRHIRTLLVALVVAALGLGVATPSHAGPARERAEVKARKALNEDRKRAAKAEDAPAVVQLRGVVEAPGNPMTVAVQESDVEAYRAAMVSVAFDEDAFVSLNGKQARLATIVKGDRVKITALPKAENAVTAYLARFERRDPKPVRLQGKVKSVADGALTIFARGMDQKITYATESAVLLRDRKDVSDTNKIAVGDHCSIAGFPSTGATSDAVAAYYVSCKSMPAKGKGKPAGAPEKGKRKGEPPTTTTT